VRIEVPPLRERREDINALARQFLRASASKHGRRVRALDEDALALLAAYEWPGNVRELAHVLERAVILAEGERVTPAELPEGLRAAATLERRRTQRPTLAELEAEYIADTLKAVGGNKSAAARALGISRKNLYEKIARYKIDVRCQ
jgi:DNA-binding NtrC family response regulator